jgi:hypothetical protein
MKSLTSALPWDYAFSAGGVPSVEIGVSMKRRTTAASGFFASVIHSNTLLYGRFVWGALGLADSFSRYANLHESAHPIGVGRAENLTRLKRSLT